jgi:predicted AlkP superfamily pyrophosphatase or phosphodiesterase
MASAKRKKLILLVVDSFHPHALKRSLESKMVPALSYIINRGYFTDRCVSVFPTMTPTCAGSIATGTLPSQHQIPGFVWYSRKEKRMINYGMTLWAVLKLGVRRVIQDLLFNLNHNQLSSRVKTIYETLEQAGFTTGAVNPYIFRAGSAHNTKIPLSLGIASAFKLGGPVWGPESLFLGRIVPPPGLKGNLLSWYFFRKYGVNDNYSGSVSELLIKGGRQPDFLSVYLPDTDGYAHHHDPARTERSLGRVDGQLQKILNCFGSWTEALHETMFIITGDHAQSLVQNSSDHMINLANIFNKFSLLQLDERAGEKDMALCINERMCHIYFLKQGRHLPEEVLEVACGVSGIDQIAWRETGWYKVVRGGLAGEVLFRPGREYTDEYGQCWDVKGDPGVLDITLSQSELAYGDYPDALNRLQHFLDCEQAGDMVLTARPGYEFTDKYSPSHRGSGSHGSLFREDSLVPLLISDRYYAPQRPRIQDIAGIIYSFFGLPR